MGALFPSAQIKFHRSTHAAISGAALAKLRGQTPIGGPSSLYNSLRSKPQERSIPGLGARNRRKLRRGRCELGGYAVEYARSLSFGASEDSAVLKRFALAAVLFAFAALLPGHEAVSLVPAAGATNVAQASLPPFSLRKTRHRRAVQRTLWCRSTSLAASTTTKASAGTGARGSVPLLARSKRLRLAIAPA